MRIDLHTHSNRSDGTEAPGAVVRAAAAAGLDVIALTDHDTTAGWEEAADTARTVGIQLVRGAELSCADAGRTIHLLAYLFDPADEVLINLCRRTHAARAGRVTQLVANIARDYPLTEDEVYAQARPGVAIGRPHIADAMIARGYFPDRDAVFRRVLHPGGPYYVCLWSADVRAVMRAVRAAGGVAVWAHPRAAKRQRLVPTPTIGEVARLGLFGLEADHRDHTAEGRVAVRTIAAHYGLAVTGASDYHGQGKPNRLGENLTAPAVYHRLVAAGSIPVV